MRWEAETGYHLAIDLATQPAIAAELPSAEEDELAEAILRDRSARRLDQTVTVAGADAALRRRSQDGTKSA